MKFALLLLLSVGLRAQSPAFISFSSTVKGALIGPAHCYFWSSPPNVQVACYNAAGGLVQNAVYNVPLADIDQTFGFPTGSIRWKLSGSPIQYQIVITPLAGALSINTGTF